MESKLVSGSLVRMYALRSDFRLQKSCKSHSFNKKYMQIKENIISHQMHHRMREFRIRFQNIVFLSGNGWEIISSGRGHGTFPEPLKATCLTTSAPRNSSIRLSFGSR
ncbi:hypothetical protein CEXT_33981 [Caerostris extrusa]|uniref:Uncharacterized protein n=1 Tax=Caerostris extrusa TaxID=172846 RepID=A0AAV4XMF8_CAEEX|nr:hypothetical protein CEXT_33981 [Caerostris extrusa]